VAPGGYLALLGDIFDGQKIRDGSYRDYLLRQCVGFAAVFVLAGNHEFYRAEYNKSRAALAELCEEVTEKLGGATIVHFLDCGRVDLPGTELRILGCTLWSYVGPDHEEDVANCLSDYSSIRVAPEEVGAVSSDGVEEPGGCCRKLQSSVGNPKATVADTNSWHARELAWLESEISQAESDGRRCIVLTHHAPSFYGTCAPEYLGSQISAAFCTNLERLLRPPVAAWLFGHTHWSSWQKYCPSTDTGTAGLWSSLSRESTRRVQKQCGPCDAELTRAVCDVVTAQEVLVASNQLGYGAQGTHTKSRCHPWMALEMPCDGAYAALRCGASPEGHH